MKTTFRLGACIVALSAGWVCGSARSAEPPAAASGVSSRPYYPAVTLPRTAQFDMRALSSDRTYRIFVSTPAAPPPAGGYPVLYMLDGNAHFATAVMRLSGSMAIVGIGYPTDQLIDAEARRYDLAPSPDKGWQPPSHLAGPAGSQYGGDAQFIQFIEQELKPKVEREFSISYAQQALFGQGLGGVLALHVLLTRPSTFQAYIVSSPSATWNDGFLLDEQRRFESTLCKPDVNVSVLFGLAGLEPEHAANPAPGTRTANDVSLELAKRLGELKNCQITTTVKMYEDEAHNTLSPGVIGRIARFWKPSPAVPSAGPARTQPAYASEVTIANTGQFDMRSTQGKRDYRVFVAEPTAPAPASGYPVIYLLDANATFVTALQALRVTKQNAVLVGVGYPTATPYEPRARRYDFTPQSPQEWRPPPSSAGPPGSVYGGQDSFTDFLLTDLKPIIERRFKIDPTKQALLGHGLSGLYVLHTLLSAPRTFQTYLSIAPSVQWDNATLIGELRRFESQLCQPSIAATLLITDEQENVPGEVPASLPADFVDKHTIAQRLGALTKCQLNVIRREYADENHYSVVPAAIARALRIALPSK